MPSAHSCTADSTNGQEDEGGRPCIASHGNHQTSRCASKSRRPAFPHSKRLGLVVGSQQYFFFTRFRRFLTALRTCREVFQETTNECAFSTVLGLSMAHIDPDRRRLCEAFPQAGGRDFWAANKGSLQNLKKELGAPTADIILFQEIIESERFCGPVNWCLGKSKARRRIISKRLGNGQTRFKTDPKRSKLGKHNLPSVETSVPSAQTKVAKRTNPRGNNNNNTGDPPWNTAESGRATTVRRTSSTL